MLNELDAGIALAHRDMEINLLANVVRDNGILYRTNVDEKHFSNPTFAELWGMLQVSIRGGETVTPSNFRTFLGDQLGLDGMGKEIATVAAGGGWAILDPENYGKNMREESQRRHARATAEDLIDRLNGPSAEIGHCISQAIQDLRDGMEIRELADAGEVHRNILAELENPVRLFPTGLDCIDDVTLGGFQSGMFYGLGGRYKAGKSFLMTTISYNMLQNCRHVYLTLESTKEQLYKRMLARAMGVNANVFLHPDKRRNPVFRGHVENAQEFLTEHGLYMQTVPRMDLASLRSTLEQAVLKYEIEGAFVDYMQLVGGDPKISKALHYEDVAQSLSELTREFGIWIVAAAQMNQEGNVRWGEGLLMACDMALILNKCDENEPGTAAGDSWLEMRASRYTPVLNAGAPDNPALRLDGQIGPHFRSLVG